MAYYVWLNDEHEEIINKRQWPMEIGEWTETVISPIVHKKGWQVVPGSHVCENIPWRFLPASLYRVEVEGEESRDGAQSSWERARLVECYGTLFEDQAVELSLAWSSAILAHYQHPTYYRGPDDVAKLDSLVRVVDEAHKWHTKETDKIPTDRAIRTGNLPMIYMTKTLKAASSPDPLLKWVYALYIPSEVRSNPLKLELARVLSERLRK